MQHGGRSRCHTYLKGIRDLCLVVGAPLAQQKLQWFLQGSNKRKIIPNGTIFGIGEGVKNFGDPGSLLPY
jgi:hypothetical protein